MKIASNLTNKNSSIKNHFLPSAITAAVAVAVAVPLTAALSGGSIVGAAAQTPSNSSTPVCGSITKAVAPAVSTAFHYVPQTVTAPTGNNSGNSGNNSGNTGGNGGGTGSTNSGSQNTGATTATGGLVGAAVSVPVNALNNDNILNNVASGNTVSVPALNNTLDTLNGTLNNVLTGADNGLLGGLGL